MAGKKPSLEAEIAELYGQPLGQWTAERNALAARLRAAGRKADAEAVKALRKPSLSVWAVNQLFRSEGERMDELLAAGQRARAAQGQAVAGRGAEVFREALKAARRQIEELRRRAAGLLAEGGKPAGAAVVERVGTDLEALAFSPAAAAQGKRGYLDADLDPPGFEVLTGVRLAAPTPGATRTPPATRQAEPTAAPAQPSRLLQFKKPPAETRAAAAARKREEAEAARRARAEEKRRERVERAEAAVTQAEEKATALRGEADAADRQAAEARRQATLAERDAAAVRRRAEAAEAELDRARERLAAERSSP